MDTNFKIYHMDCMEAMKNIPSNSVDLILTDPPYNLGLFMKGRATNLKAMRNNFFGAAGWDNLTFEEWKKVMENLFSELSRIIKDSGSVIMFMSIIKVESIILLAEKYGFYYKTTGIWHKKNPMPRNMNLHFINSTEAWLYFTYKTHTGTFNNKGKAIHDFFETSITPVSEKKYGKHPTQKPVKLLKTFISLLTNEGDVVFDPFCGSGSSGVAAISMNRKFIGADVNEEYCNITNKRIKQVVKNEL